jgi:hypothetical protein
VSVTLERRLASPDATAGLGAEIALWLRPGDFLALTGPLGAGKTVLARAIVSALGSAPVEVPSPSFTLVQHYPELRLPAAHFDLYRIAGAGELDELGLDDALERGVALVEWADRLGDALPPDRLDVMLADGAGDHARVATLTGHGAWQERLGRSADLAGFIAGAGWSGAGRHWLKGDASTRSYERLVDRASGRSAVLMNAPRGPDGPPVRDGKPYSRIAHLAEDVRAFIAVDRHLLALGLSAPRILAQDPARGFLVLEDLGDGLYGGLVASGRDTASAYEAAVDALCRVQAEPPPGPLDTGCGHGHVVPRYDLGALLIEVELLIDWAWPAWLGAPCPADARAAYRDVWGAALGALAAERVLVLRDFHSPNLLWLADRSGAARAGLIDFQDAVIGHPAYDLVSLAQDARVDLPDGLERFIIERWMAGRPTRLAGLARADFAADYALMGAQRAAKIAGIFTRLAVRDGKPSYLAHMPRVVRHLRTNLGHPRLAPVLEWFHRHLDLDRAPERLAVSA